MEILTVTLIFACGIVVACMIYAIFIYRQGPKHVDPRVLTLMQQHGELQIEVADLRGLYERLLASHKRLRSAEGMAKLREKRSGTSTGSDAEVLARLGLIGGQKK